MDKDAFLQDHAGRVGLGDRNWARLYEREDIAIDEEVVEITELASAYAPWYYLPGDTPRPIDYGGAVSNEYARAIRLSETDLINMYPEHTEKIQRYQEELLGTDAPRFPIIVAEDTVAGSLFIPDGNHTAIALYRNLSAGTANYEPIPAIVIRGPNLGDIFGDMNIVNRR